MKTTMTDLAPIAAPEFKAGPGDIAGAFDDFSRTFEAFKEVNDRRLEEIESRMGTDPLTEEKLTRIDNALDTAQRRLDQMVMKSRRPALIGSDLAAVHPRENEQKAAFATYLRTGQAPQSALLEAKDYTSAVGADGGFLVPQPAERETLSRMALISPIRAISEVREVSTATFKKVFATNGPVAGWVAETGARNATASQVFADLTFATPEIYAMPAVTPVLLEDAAIDVEAFVMGEIETVFAEMEGDAFINGNGTDKPRGFLNYTKVANGTWSWGNIGYNVTGVSAGFAASNPSDNLIDLVFTLKSGYRQNGRFVMNRRTQAQVRKFKDSTGNYLWHPPVSAGLPSTLMHFPVTDAEQMPDIAADSYSIAFGDFKRGYLVVDRRGMTLLRDPYTAKPYIRYYVTKRIGGGVQDFDAIKLLKFGTV
jgi:HK97 family phage major capsid protein